MNSFSGQLQSKFSGTLLRVADIFLLLPKRVARLARHLRGFCWHNRWWYIETGFYCLDIIGVPELYETFADWLKWHTRPLSEEEFRLLRPVFKDSIDYKRVRIDERARLGPPQLKICYVSFCTVNSWGKMHDALLMHEMVHVWQFTRMGSVYIVRALQAQRSKEGYNYGGGPRVSTWAQKGARLTDFNLEQQADLVADAWRLRQGKRPQWGPSGPADLPYYEYFLSQLSS